MLVIAALVLRHVGVVAVASAVALDAAAGVPEDDPEPRATVMEALLEPAHDVALVHDLIQGAVGLVLAAASVNVSSKVGAGGEQIVPLEPIVTACALKGPLQVALLLGALIPQGDVGAVVLSAMGMEAHVLSMLGPEGEAVAAVPPGVVEDLAGDIAAVVALATSIVWVVPRCLPEAPEAVLVIAALVLRHVGVVAVASAVALDAAAGVPEDDPEPRATVMEALLEPAHDVALVHDLIQGAVGLVLAAASVNVSSKVGAGGEQIVPLEPIVTACALKGPLQVALLLGALIPQGDVGAVVLSAMGMEAHVLSMLGPEGEAVLRVTFGAVPDLRKHHVGSRVCA